MEKKKQNFFQRRTVDHSTHSAVFWPNEIQANILTAVAMCISTSVLILCWLLNVIGFFETGKAINSVALFCSIEMLVPAILCFIFKGQKKWLKYVMMIAYVFALGHIDMVLSYNVTIIMVVPVVISCRYYSHYMTAQIAMLTVVAFLASTIFGSYYNLGSLDLNFYGAKWATDITIRAGETIKESLFRQGLVDPQTRMRTLLLLGFIPKWLNFSVISVVCLLIARRGYEMVINQAEISTKNAHIESELNLASDIQANMLPSIFPPFPDHKEFDIFALMNPAREVGGDFYDFFMVDDIHVAVVIGDVSGKGVPAALFMVTAKTLIKDHAQLGLNPEEVLTRVNKILCDGNDANLFVTGWIGILNIKTGVLKYANAGHNAPLLKNGNYPYQYLKSTPGFVLAGIDTYKYKQSEITLQKGSKLFLYTDGVTEATRNDDTLYGEERLLKYINTLAYASVEETIKGIRKDIDLFIEDAEQFDDITMLVLEYKNALEVGKEIFLDATDDNLQLALDFIEESLTEFSIEMQYATPIAIAIEEVYVNVAHYGYVGRSGKIKILCDMDGDDIVITVKDKGIPFNPLSKADPDINQSAEERKIGGLGIFMVKKIMDSVNYEYKDEMNILIMRKKVK